MMVFKAEKKNLELIIHVDENVPEFVIGDAVRLKQIMTNLLSNAIKFTHEGEIILEIREKNREDGISTLECNVTDTGIGIPSDKQYRIFDSFSQVDLSTTRNYGGTGLGLAITKSLVALMNGRISVKSEEGVGSTFTCSLKLPVKKSRKPDAQQQQEFKSCTIYCGNKNISQCLYTSKKLEPFGIKTKNCSTIPELISEIKKNSSSECLLLQNRLVSEASDSEIETLKSLTTEKNIPVVSLYPFGQNLDKRNPFDQFKLTAPINRNGLFEILLKTRQRSEKTVPEQEEKKQHIPRDIKILVAEDTLVNQVVAKNLLKSIGYAIDIADNGKKAVEMYDSNYYDLILMDVQMPEMDGLEATKALRLKEIKPKQPIIIAMTANASEEDKKMCLFAGMDDFSSKPVTRDQIVNKIEKWFPLS